MIDINTLEAGELLLVDEPALREVVWEGQRFVHERDGLVAAIYAGSYDDNAEVEVGLIYKDDPDQEATAEYIEVPFTALRFASREDFDARGATTRAAFY